MHPAAKKSLGQHFLSNPQICQRIAHLLVANPEANLLEIGPGPGALTREIVKIPHREFFLLEKDSYWAKVQKIALPQYTVILADALQFPWQNLTGLWQITGNLPYNIASPLIWEIVSKVNAMQRGVFMVQKEVGLRLAAVPGNKNYGALSVWVQSFCKTRLEFTLGPGAFTPAPKVDSAVLVFEPQKNKNLADCRKLKKLLNLCFQKRRKQLGTIFKTANLHTLLAGMRDLKLNLNLRPENLSPNDFCLLSNYMI